MTGAVASSAAAGSAGANPGLPGRDTTGFRTDTAAVFKAVADRRSYSKVTTLAPSRAELLPLVAAAARVADHGALRPWRLLELRGDARDRLGAAFVAASACEGLEAIKLAAKPLRAPLLIAIVASRQVNFKVAGWEQDAAAAGVAHLLTLLLENAGWGAMWRTGPLVRSAPVRALHGLADGEELLGWLYVGGIPEESKPCVRLSIDPEEFLGVL
ncbi:nitroreductase [Cryobacterium sp. TMS1-20-1]|uniref:nitroreductase family protein n=1 Tax=Cryobacterium sp. TMS1-20-1 TaxID=1259223 RepID=UPI00106A6B1C|nr:nitroreductase family protein [Cryobacterium sp. TMS1-20-1]TFC72568.1 nitroreductase [Cryobacterium sp. TMS1-20-1]